MTDTMAERFSAEIVRAQIVSVLRAWGMAEDNIAVTAEIMVETDLLGVDSHGLSMQVLYEQMQKAGGFWIHRVLQSERIESHVVDPASGAISRRRVEPRPTRLMAKPWCGP